jgi:hypothetical protein
MKVIDHLLHHSEELMVGIEGIVDYRKNILSSVALENLPNNESLLVIRSGA